MQNLIPKIFGWMFIGLMVTFVTGYIISVNPQMLASLFESGWAWGTIIIEFVLVIFLSARIGKMNPTTAKISFLLYSFVSGLTFSTIFITYEMSSIIWIFFVTSALFGIFAVYGYFTKKDLSKWGNILFMALIGILICYLLSIFIKNQAFDLVVSSIVVILFVLFTAYDLHRIKVLNDANFIAEDNLAIYGALQLYLDFINIFIELLQLMGKRDN